LSVIEIDVRLCQTGHERDVRTVDRLRDCERGIDVLARCGSLRACVKHVGRHDVRDRLVQGATACLAQSQHLGLMARGACEVVPDECLPYDEPAMPEAEAG